MTRALGPAPWFATLERLRHRIPFWWWLTYDALVGVVVWFGVSPSDPAFWLGFFVLGIAVVIDTAEFIVKRPAARAALAAPFVDDSVCPSCGGDAADNWFDRSVCPCDDVMHTRCRNCGHALDGCAFQAANSHPGSDA